MATLIVRDYLSLINVVVPFFYGKLRGYKGVQFQEWMRRLGISTSHIHIEEYSICTNRGNSGNLLTMTQKSGMGAGGGGFCGRISEKEKGYGVIERNKREKWGELDIVVMAPDKTPGFCGS